MFVAKNIPLQMQLNLLDRLAAIVGDMNVDIYAGTADPNLSMQAGCQSNDFKCIVAGL